MHVHSKCPTSGWLPRPCPQRPSDDLLKVPSPVNSATEWQQSLLRRDLWGEHSICKFYHAHRLRCCEPRAWGCDHIVGVRGSLPAIHPPRSLPSVTHCPPPILPKLPRRPSIPCSTAGVLCQSPGCGKATKEGKASLPTPSLQGPDHK